MRARILPTLMSLQKRAMLLTWQLDVHPKKVTAFHQSPHLSTHRTLRTLHLRQAFQRRQHRRNLLSSVHPLLDANLASGQWVVANVCPRFHSDYVFEKWSSTTNFGSTQFLHKHTNIRQHDLNVTFLKTIWRQDIPKVSDVF